MNGATSTATRSTGNPQRSNSTAMPVLAPSAPRVATPAPHRKLTKRIHSGDGW